MISQQVYVYRDIYLAEACYISRKIRHAHFSIFGTLVTGTERVCWIFLVRWRLGQKEFIGYFWYTGDWDRNSLLNIFGTLVTETKRVCWIFLVRWRLGQKEFVGYFWYAGDWDRSSLLDIFGTLATGTETVC